MWVCYQSFTLSLSREKDKSVSARSRKRAKGMKKKKIVYIYIYIYEHVVAHLNIRVSGSMVKYHAIYFRISSLYESVYKKLFFFFCNWLVYDIDLNIYICIHRDRCVILCKYNSQVIVQTHQTLS